MTDCDYCKNIFNVSDLFNVEYLDEDCNPNGWANVLCEDCLQVSIDIHGERFVEAWN